MTAAKRPPTPRWIAGVDRVAHAHRRPAREYLCGRRLLDERYAWPALRRCDTCQSVLALEVIRANAEAAS